MKKLLLLFALALCHTASLFAQERLFFVSRNLNRNIIVYDIQLKNGALDVDNPLHVYWYNQEHNPITTNELNFIQRKLAYGYTVVGQGENEATVKLKAYKKRLLTVRRHDGKWVGTTTINGGVITDNNATGVGGAVSTGTMNLAGGSIIGNSSEYGFAQDIVTLSPLNITGPLPADSRFGVFYCDSSVSPIYGTFTNGLAGNGTADNFVNENGSDQYPMAQTSAGEMRYLNHFTITWKNGDAVIETDENVLEGSTPSYDGVTPTKAEDAQYTYTFSGWTDGTNTYGLSDDLPAVSNDVVYTATYATSASPAADVIALIDAIGEVVLTDECKAKIDAARSAYNALTDAQKALVNNYETLQLAEGQYAALQLAADMTAFEAYKTEKKNAMDALAEEGDSEEVLQIIGLAKTQIDYAAYDESMTLAENKAALDALVAGVPAAVAAQRNADRLDEYKAAFEDHKNEVLRYLQSLEEPDDSAAAAAIIVNAISAVNDIGYDESKTFAENKAAVDAAADIADALAAQRAADEAAADKAAAEEAEALIDAIGDVEYTDESKAKIDEARAAYDALTDDQKALVKNYDALTDAEAKYAELKAAAEAPDEPEAPEAPEETDRNYVCHLCGEIHDRRTLSGWLISYLHDVLFVFRNLLFGWF